MHLLIHTDGTSSLPGGGRGGQETRLSTLTFLKADSLKWQAGNCRKKCVCFCQRPLGKIPATKALQCDPRQGVQLFLHLQDSGHPQRKSIFGHLPTLWGKQLWGASQACGTTHLFLYSHRNCDSVV